MKKNNLKTTGIVVASLAAVALVSVGFSAWVITSLTPTDKQSINLTVASTTDNSIALAVTGTPDLDVKFDALSTDTTGDITGTSDSKCDLEFGFTFTITTKTGINVPDRLASITPTFDALTGLSDSITANYVVAPLTSGTALKVIENDKTVIAAGTFYDGVKTEAEPVTGFKEKYVISGDTNVYTVVATFRFAWGSYFGGKNPSECDSAMSPVYNSHTLDNIKTALAALQTNLNTKTIANLVLTPAGK